MNLVNAILSPGNVIAAIVRGLGSAGSAVVAEPTKPPGLGTSAKATHD